MGGFTAFFDLGVGLGAPLAGAISAVAGYPAAFGVAAGAAAAGALLTLLGDAAVSSSGPRKLGPSADAG
jgi:predicted MFS family arabinose efflux permease